MPVFPFCVSGINGRRATACLRERRRIELPSLYDFFGWLDSPGSRGPRQREDGGSWKDVVPLSRRTWIHWWYSGD